MIPWKMCFYSSAISLSRRPPCVIGAMPVAYSARRQSTWKGGGAGSWGEFKQFTLQVRSMKSFFKTSSLDILHLLRIFYGTWIACSNSQGLGDNSPSTVDRPLKQLIIDQVWLRPCRRSQPGGGSHLQGYGGFPGTCSNVYQCFWVV